MSSTLGLGGDGSTGDESKDHITRDGELGSTGKAYSCKVWPGTKIKGIFCAF